MADRTSEDAGDREDSVSMSPNAFRKAWRLSATILSNRYVSAVLFMLIAMLLAVHFRMYSYHMSITDEWARVNVEADIRNLALQQAFRDHPDLQETALRARADEIYRQYYEINRERIEQKIRLTSERFRSEFQYDNGHVYLSDIDTYYYFRLTRNYVTHGHPGEYLKDGVPTTNLRLAPSEMPVPLDFHVWFQGQAFRLANLFFSVPPEEVYRTIYFNSIIGVVLAIVPAFFIGALLSGSSVGGFVAASLLGLHVSILTRTQGGMASTDPYNVFFPIMLLLFTVLALRDRRFLPRAGFGALAGISLGIFSHAWSAWWFIFIPFMLSLLLYTLYLILQTIWFTDGAPADRLRAVAADTRIRTFSAFAASFLVASMLIVSYFRSFGHFLGAFRSMLGYRAIRDALHSDLWPKVFTTVSELNPGTLREIIHQIGGPTVPVLFFSASLTGIATLMYRSKCHWYPVASATWYMVTVFLAWAGWLPAVIGGPGSVFLLLIAIPILVGVVIRFMSQDQDRHVLSAVFLAIWFAAGLYAATKGIRFTLLLAPAYVVGLAVLLGRLHKSASSHVARLLRLPVKAVAAVLLAIAVLLLIPSIKVADKVGRESVPIVDDGWYGTLTGIRDKAPPDAIISSWWDLGHQFAALAERAVTIDGGTQNSPQAHWLGRMLVAHDPGITLGVLRMLNCGGNRGFEKINAITNDDVLSVGILNRLFGTNRMTARQVLAGEGFTDDQIEDVLRSTHCVPPASYVITSEDMVPKAIVFAHIGSWDFARARVWQAVRSRGQVQAVEEIAASLGLDAEEAGELYAELKGYTETRAQAWIAPWLGYVAELSACSPSRMMPGAIQCGNSLLYDVSNEEGYFRARKGLARAGMVIIYGEEGVRRIPSSRGNPEVTTVFVEKGGNIVGGLASDPMHAESSFTKLFFLEGAGMEHFRLFSDKRSITGGRILVWEVDWDGYLLEIGD